ncbi:MAG: hypothetical protein N3B15_01175 [Planctomycetota bacterium]|nr:hypothetical protein [Planctomycetota bacterium]
MIAFMTQDPAAETPSVPPSTAPTPPAGEPAPPEAAAATDAAAAAPTPEAAGGRRKRSAAQSAANKGAAIDYLGPEAKRARSAVIRDIRAALERPEAPRARADKATSATKGDALAETVHRASPRTRSVIGMLLKHMR